jgi:transcriptional repressor NrdR
MKCPFCGAPDTQVVDSRISDEGNTICRRRRCMPCGKRFTTYETAELRLPQVVKQNGKREEYLKNRTSFLRALHKRPVATETVDAAIDRIGRRCLLGEREVIRAAWARW